MLHYIEKNIEEVSKNLGISERTIRYRIKSLNEFFVDEKINYKITIKNGIIKGSGNFSNLLESVKREDYDFSKEERIEIIYFLLLLLSYGCKADAICCFLNISRNTLKSDMKFVRKKLTEKNLQICSRTKRGLIIQGREILIRKLLLEEYKKILMPKMTKLLMEGLIPILLTWAIIPAKGNIFRALVSSIIIMSLMLFIASSLAPLLTRVAGEVGFHIPDGTGSISSLDGGAHILSYLLWKILGIFY